MAWTYLIYSTGTNVEKTPVTWGQMSEEKARFWYSVSCWVRPCTYQPTLSVRWWGREVPLSACCEGASGAPLSVAPVLQARQIQQRQNSFSLMLTEAKQILIEDFYFDLPSNERRCHASKNCLHICVAEEGEEIHWIRASLSHFGVQQGD